MKKDVTLDMQKKLADVFIINNILRKRPGKFSYIEFIKEAYKKRQRKNEKK